MTALLMPSLPASVVERVLGRTVYSETQECDAERLASLIMRRIGHIRRGQIPRTHVTTALSGLAGVLDFGTGRPRG